MSKKKEQLARDAFRKAALGRLNIKLIENQLSQGTPDSININKFGAAFWLEFKALDKWPARETTKPLLNSFEPGQQAFLKEWTSWKGWAFVLIKAGDEWLLIRPEHNVHLDQLVRSELCCRSSAIGLEPIIRILENIR